MHFFSSFKYTLEFRPPKKTPRVTGGGANSTVQIQAVDEAVQEVAEIVVWATDDIAQGVHCEHWWEYDDRYAVLRIDFQVGAVEYGEGTCLETRRLVVVEFSLSGVENAQMESWQREDLLHEIGSGQSGFHSHCLWLLGHLRIK
jgi:hypothetical protein